MFGLVPRPLWMRRCTPDDRNRVDQNAHSLLVELPDGRRGLIETGCGSATNFSEKEIDLHALGPGWPLMENLRGRGVEPASISFIACTHLHWDHAGGIPAPAPARAGWAFPAAALWVHEFEWQDALSRNPLLYKSYPVELMERLEAGRIQRVTDDHPEIAPGLQLIRSSGHTRGHCAVVFRGDVEIAFPAGPVRTKFAVFAGDVCPTRHNLRMVFQTSYDTFPLDTRAWKRAWLPRLAAERGILLFDHDPDLFGAIIREDEREEFAVETEFRVRN